MTTNQETDTFLEHFGVKGMKWGVSRDRNRPGGADGKSNGSSSKKTAAPEVKKLTRKEVRAEKKQFYLDRSERAAMTALKDKDSLIYTRDAFSNYPTVVTGKEFADFLARGGAFDVKMTQVYAQKDKTGVMAVDKDFNKRFVRSDRKK